MISKLDKLITPPMLNIYFILFVFSLCYVCGKKTYLAEFVGGDEPVEPDEGNEDNEDNRYKQTSWGFAVPG